MRINAAMTQPSMPLTPACTLPTSKSMPSAAPVALSVLAAERAPASWAHQVPAVAVPAVAAAPSLVAQASRAHQVQVQAQAELVLLPELVGVGTRNGNTTGFLGLGLSVSERIDSKRYADGDGVPPRGRPV